MESIINQTEVLIYLSADSLCATLSIDEDFEDPTFVQEKIQSLIDEKHIVYGIDHDKIDDIVNRHKKVIDTIIAKGSSAVDGEDSKGTFHFDLNHQIAPKANKDGSVNHKDLGFVEAIKKDALLFEQTQPTDGIDGITVQGDVIRAKCGSMLRIKAGKNCTLSNDGLRITSDITGIVSFDNNTISVNPLLEIPGDIGPETGNIIYEGDVSVKGNITSGMTVKCHNLEVNGVVEKAKLVISGDVLIKNGIQGNHEAHINCLGNLTCQYINCADVYAKGNINADMIINSQIRCDRHLYLSGKKGHIIGGKAIIRGNVQAKNIGSDLGVITEFLMGETSLVSESIRIIREEIENQEELFTKTEQCLALLKTKIQAMPNHEQYRHLNAEYTRKKFTLQHELTKKNQKLLRLENKYTESSLTELSANMIYPGVHINMGDNHIHINSRHKHYIVKSVRGELITQEH